MQDEPCIYKENPYNATGPAVVPATGYLGERGAADHAHGCLLVLDPCGCSQPYGTLLELLTITIRIHIHKFCISLSLKSLMQRYSSQLWQFIGFVYFA